MSRGDEAGTARGMRQQDRTAKHGLGTASKPPSVLLSGRVWVCGPRKISAKPRLARVPEGRRGGPIDSFSQGAAPPFGFETSMGP